MALRAPHLIAPIVLGTAGVAVLLGLGAWQVQRLDWKERLIARLEARIEAEPVPLPEEPEPERDEFRTVRIEGTVASPPAWVLTTQRPHGPGFRTIVAVETGGRRVMADLGYVPEERKDAAPPEGTPLTLEGALFWPEPTSSTPPAEGDLFFSRAPEPLAERLGAEPVLVVAATHSLAPPPTPQRLGVDLPNNHLNYAITWFSLAAVWGVMSVAWARRRVAEGVDAASGPR